MQHRFSRTELLVGSDGIEKLKHSKVAVFGVGGVGSYAVEGLARAGVGNLVLVDYDDICLTNINRQIHALEHTVGRSKVELMKERVFQINPDCQVRALQEFYTPEEGPALLEDDFDYIIDAIDNVTGKLDLIKQAKSRDIPIICAMGAGNKLDPTAFQVADISKTSVCPLAKVIRRELRKAGIKKGVKVVYSTEPARTPIDTGVSCRDHCVCSNPDARSSCSLRRQIPGSISFVPSVAGLILAGAVVNDLLGIELTKQC